ncbi:L-aspartate oxidase [Alkalihalophilus pseudofirmus]|uniref:L-aspartate oxidase n=1 Tax=Alkalihalophilus pseudofirmus TaxID=79885 RepID=A0AAJ2NQ83_ALKPS|nr:L-aspartate oxidase [Alkalihalophilus pseudofirmus]
MLKTDVLIIGGGLAAVVCALKLVDRYEVTIAMKGSIESGNSWRAQGGIAAALSSLDHPFIHYKDTMKAGCYQNNKQLVEMLVKEGPRRLRGWMKEGLNFDQTMDGELLLGQEGAHSIRRIVHNQGDQTGKVCMSYFWSKLQQKKVRILSHYQAIDLIVENEVCDGAWFKNKQNELIEVRASATILATGGIGGLYEATTNDPSLIGEGLVMAYRAGAILRDLEFIQFHPTLIYSQGRTAGLASEALRGEGARLVDQEGTPIMDGRDDRGDLAPRDVVARVIYEYTKKEEPIFLDISPISNFKDKFPQITSLCNQAQVDLEKQRIPVCPGAHFHMGGVETNTNGATSIANLYAVGEVSGNNVHGANRLASNSLLEALVFGERLGEFLLIQQLKRELTSDHDRYIRAEKVDGPFALPSKNELKRKVTQALGITRTSHDLEQLLSWLGSFRQFDQDVYRRVNWTREQIEIDTMCTAAMLIAKSALARKESLGAHFRNDSQEIGRMPMNPQAMMQARGDIWAKPVKEKERVLK